MFDHLFFGDYFKNKQKQINLGELTLKHKVSVGKNIFTWDLGGKPLKISPPGPPWPFRRRLRRALRRPLRQLRQLQRLGRRRRRRHGLAVLGELALAAVDRCLRVGTPKGNCRIFQWIGLRENLQETMVLTIKYSGFL